MSKQEIEPLLRLKQILGYPKAVPPIEPIVPVSRSHWWAGVKSGRYPKPIKLAPRVTVWSTSSIRAVAINTKGAMNE